MIQAFQGFKDPRVRGAEGKLQKIQTRMDVLKRYFFLSFVRDHALNVVPLDPLAPWILEPFFPTNTDLSTMYYPGFSKTEETTDRQRIDTSPRRRGMRMNRSGLLLAVLFISFLWAPFAAAAGGRAYVSTDAGYRTGDFGTETTFRLFHLTSAIGYASDTWEAGLSVPVYSLQADGDLGTQTASGIGDVMVRAGRRIVSEEKAGIELTGSVAVKLPTADEDKGLGTGETDYGVFMLLNKRFGTIALMAQVGYLVRGDASIQAYNDTPMVAVGLSKSFNRSQVAAIYENDGEFVDGAEAARSIGVSGFRVMNPKYAVRGGLSFGLSDGADDLGMSIGFVRLF